MAKRISVDDLEGVVDEFLQMSVNAEMAETNAHFETVARECAETLRAESPKSETVKPDSERYAEGWAYALEERAGVMHHLAQNKKFGWKTAILENGTGQRKTDDGENRGIMPPHPHFAAAVRKSIEELRQRYG